MEDDADDLDLEDDLLEPGVRVWGLKRMPLDMPEAEARRVLEEHDGLLRHVMRRYRLPAASQGITREDQYAIGQAVLLQAYKQHDPKLGAFSTFAVQLLKQSFSYLARRARGQTKSEQVHYLRVRAGETLTPAQQACVERYEQRRFVAIVALPEELGARSPAGTSRAGISEEVISDGRDPETEHVERDLREWLYAKLANRVLSAQERRVVHTYLSGVTFAAIGAQIGVSRERVRQVWNSAVTKLQIAAEREQRRR